MESTVENNNMVLPAEKQEYSKINQSESCLEPLTETGSNQIYLEMMREIYAYCVTEDIVTGMHMALGKPHHATQMNI